MNEYEIEAVLWEDHYHVMGSALPEDIDYIPPTLTVGIILKETEKVIAIIHDIERFGEGLDLSYSVILKSAIISRKKFGTIEISD